MKTLNIEVEGMNCGGCVSKITNHFQAMEWVNDTRVNLDNQLVEISSNDDFSNMKVRNDLIELGFSVRSIKKA